MWYDGQYRILIKKVPARKFANVTPRGIDLEDQGLLSYRYYDTISFKISLIHLFIFYYLLFYLTTGNKAVRTQTVCGLWHSWDRMGCRQMYYKSVASWTYKLFRR